MKSPTTPRTLLALGSASLLLVGCATPQATYVDPAGSRTITTVGGINIQDYANAADTMVSSLIDGVINTGKLEAPAGQPAMLAISRISNNTSQHVDTDMLVKKIRVALNKTGKVVTTTTMGLGGNAEDPLAQGIKQQTEFLQDKKNTRLPDYSLSGKIIEQRERAGDVRQSSFVFQLSLTSKDGVAVWEDEKTITKQGKRSTVGF
jgi:uncharacterized protein (TIGR02722 family)